jgi:hypothetical protein
MQEYSMSNLEVRPLFGANHDKLRKLQTIIDSQRSVWEDLGAARPWWSVLSAEEYDRKLNLSESPFFILGQQDSDVNDILGDPEAETFYHSGEIAIMRALHHVDDVATRGGLAWGGGGVGNVAHTAFSRTCAIFWQCDT